MAIESESVNRRKSFANWWRDHPLYVIGGTIGTIIIVTAAVLEIIDHIKKDTPPHQIVSAFYIPPSSHTNQLKNVETYPTVIGPGNPNAQIDKGTGSNQGESESFSITNSNFEVTTKDSTTTNYLFEIENYTGNYIMEYHVKIFDKMWPTHRIAPFNSDKFTSDTPTVDIHFNPSLAWRAEDKDITIDGFPIIENFTADDWTNSYWTNAFLYSFQISEQGQIDLYPCECNLKR
jgi:hypothetical protein